jgi:hypothetical protein
MKSLIKNEWAQFVFTAGLLTMLFIAISHIGFFAWEYVFGPNHPFRRYGNLPEPYSFSDAVGISYFLGGVFVVIAIFLALAFIKLISDDIFKNDDEEEKDENQDQADS